MNIAKLKGIMAEKGISQLALAKTLNVNKDTLNSRFLGKTSFTVDEANDICKALGIFDEHTKCEIFLSTASH